MKNHKLTSMKTTLLFILMAITGLMNAAELPKVLLYGNVIDIEIVDIIVPKQEEAPDKFVDQVTVTAICKGDTISSKVNRATGFYSLVLESGKKYNVSFKKDGYITKNFVIDATDVEYTDKKKSFKMFTDVTLFQTPDKGDFKSFEDRPMAKCTYVSEKERMEWDMDFAKLAFDHFMSSAKQMSTALNSND